MDRSQASFGAGDLDVQVRCSNVTVELTGGGNGAFGVVGQSRCNLDRDVAIFAVALGVYTGEHTKCASDVGLHQTPVGIFDRVAGLDKGGQFLVVGIARADGILEDGRVRGEAAHTLSDPVGQFPRGDPVASQVVEPRALLLLIKQIMKAGHCSRSNAWSTRLLTFMPSSCMTVAPGALAPKRLMPTTSSA